MREEEGEERGGGRRKGGEGEGWRRGGEEGEGNDRSCFCVQRKFVFKVNILGAFVRNKFT